MSSVELLKGNCLDLMKNITDNSIDMILCDLPYGTTACPWDIIIPFEPMWEQIKRIVKINGAVCLFGVEPFSSMLRLSNLKDYHYDVYWQKEKLTNVFNVNKQFGRVIECISVFYAKQPTYNPQMSDRVVVTNPIPAQGDLNIDETKVISGVYRHSEKYNPKKVYPVNIVKFNRDSYKGHKALHPTQKPIALLEFLLKTYTNEGETVLDFTMGSGSTGVACVNTNRNFIGMEMKDEYFDIAMERIRKNGI